VGYVLAVAFTGSTPGLTLVLVLVLLTVAAIFTRNRISPKLPRLLPVVWSSLGTGVILTVLYAVVVVIQPADPLDPRYWIPLTAGVLSSATATAGIAGEQLMANLSQSRFDIEARLSLGATPAQAIAPYRRQAVRAAVLPTLNTLTIVGMVSLPGFLSGELLGGVEPLTAAAYQTLLLIMIACSSLVTALLITSGIRRQCFNAAAQLNLP
ncbi:MAG: ABC transporter permease, partial [Cyanobacteria bacterium P01_C01_bin.73]